MKRVVPSPAPSIVTRDAAEALPLEPWELAQVVENAEQARCLIEDAGKLYRPLRSTTEYGDCLAALAEMIGTLYTLRSTLRAQGMKMWGDA